MYGLCLTLLAEGWEKDAVPDRITLHAVLATAFEAACLRTGHVVDDAYVAHGMCSAVIMMRCPEAGMPSLIREFRVVLAGWTRIRLLLTAGLVLQSGPAVRAVAECLRLARALPSGLVPRRMPDGPVVIIGDSLYQHISGLRLVAHEPADYLRIQPDGLPTAAWLYLPGHLSDRDDTPDLSRRSTSSGSPQALRAGALVDRAAELMEIGDHHSALACLEQALRYDRDGPVAERALLRLGDCHRRLGAVEAAVQAWSLLMVRSPHHWEVFLRLGRLEAQRGRADLAVGYFDEGLRLVRARPGLSAASGGLACVFLLHLADLRETAGDKAGSDELIDEAAEADPPSPLPLVALAYRAARRGDVTESRQLLEVALARLTAPPGDAELIENWQITATCEGSDVIMRVLLEHGLAPNVFKG